MCGRYALAETTDAVKALFNLENLEQFPPRYNIGPTQPILMIGTDGASQVAPVLVRWGLVPSWQKEFPSSKPLINARAETLLEKPSFKKAAMRRRCLMPVNGFYEWQRTKGATPKPYFIQQKEGDLFAMAGIWEHWQGADGSELESAAIITTQANKTLGPIHHRMPVILDKAAQARWLDVTEFSASEVYEDLRPADDDFLTAYQVSARVNKVVNDDAELLEQAPEVIEEPEVLKQENDQLSLF